MSDFHDFKPVTAEQLKQAFAAVKKPKSKNKGEWVSPYIFVTGTKPKKPTK